MLKNLLKYLAIWLLKNRLEFVRDSFFNKQNAHTGEHLKNLKVNIAAMAETRAAMFKHNFYHEMHRVVTSILGFMLILISVILSALTGLMWVFATAWTSPNRNIILGTTMILPILVAVTIYLFIRHSWQKKPIFNQSILQVESDWLVFKAGLDGTADTSEEANK